MRASCFWLQDTDAIELCDVRADCANAVDEAQSTWP
jgi:hypothetical protein